MITINETVLKQLTGLGLNDREATVYLTLLESGPATAQELSRESRRHRSSIYVALESLVEKDLIKKSLNKAGVRVYETYAPDTFIKKAAQIQKEQERVRHEIDQLVPELIALAPASVHPRVRFFEGKEGLETAKQDLATAPKQDIVRIFSTQQSFPYQQKGQSIRAIYSSHGNSSHAQKAPETDVRSVPDSKYAFSSEMRIYSNRIVLISPKEEFAAIIENEHFALVMKEMFDLAWEEAKRLDAKTGNSH